jgi:hypothetical protein
MSADLSVEQWLRQELAAIAGEADPDALSRLSSHASPTLRRRRRMAGVFAAGAAMAATVIVTLNLVGALGVDQSALAPPHEGATRPDFVRPSLAPGQPCLNAEPVSLAQVATSSSASVWLPNTTEANRKLLTGTWTCGDIPVLMFGDISLSFEPAGTITPTKLWTDLAKAHNGRIEPVLGQPGYVEPASGDARAEVLVVVDGTLIRAIGAADTTAEELKAIVSSIDTRKTIQP